MTLTFFILFSFILFLLLVLVIFINFDSLIIDNAYGQRQPLDDRSPTFLEAYWTNKDNTLSQPQDLANPLKVEVGPGEGPSTLAVILVNTGRSEISGITGYLKLPPGFQSIRGENNVKFQNVSVASYNSIVKPGESFPIYFTFNILDTAKVGPYYGSMEIVYSKVLETGQISTNITVPFRVTGKVILDVIPQKQNLITNSPNNLQILLYNKGSADANGVIVTITNISGGTTTIENKVIKNNDNGIIDNSIVHNNSINNNLESNATLSNHSNNTAERILIKQTSEKESNFTPIDIHATTFNVEEILANSTALITPVIYPDYSTGGTIQNMKLEITYNDAYGNKKIFETSVGLIISPNPPESVLSIEEARNVLVINNAIDRNGSNIIQHNSLMLRAGLIESANIIVSNNGDEELKDEYVSGGKSKKDSLSIGAYIQGQIKIRTYEVALEDIGGILNLVGNLLNEGNTVALFTTMEIINSTEWSSNVAENSLQDRKVLKQLPLKSLPVPQYLGDLTENSPLPFSIPIDIQLNAKQGEYITSLKITYKDDLRTEHNLILNETVKYKAVNDDQTNNGDNTNTNILGFTISPSITTLIITFILASMIVVVIIFIVFSIKKRKDKKSKLYKSFNNQDNSGKYFLNDDKDEERKAN